MRRRTANGGFGGFGESHGFGPEKQGESRGAQAESQVVGSPPVRITSLESNSNYRSSVFCVVSVVRSTHRKIGFFALRKHPRSDRKRPSFRPSTWPPGVRSRKRRMGSGAGGHRYERREHATNVGLWSYELEGGGQRY